MSNNQDNLDNKLSDARMTAERLLNKHRRSRPEVVKKPRSAKDYILWFFVIVSIISATQVNSQLPAYWAPASDIWVRIAVISGLVVFALVCLAFTSHGADFKVLVKEAGIELRRVTWPTKAETINWTWLSIVFMALFGLLIWAMDVAFTEVVGMIIG